MGLLEILCEEKAHILLFHLGEFGVGFRQTSLNKHTQKAEGVSVYPPAAGSPHLPACSLAKVLRATGALGVRLTVMGL